MRVRQIHKNTHKKKKCREIKVCGMRVNNTFELLSFTLRLLSPSITSSFNINIFNMLRKSLNCMLVIISVSNCLVTELMKSLIAVSQMVSTSLPLRTFDSAAYSSLDMPTVRKRLLGMQTRSVADAPFRPSASASVQHSNLVLNTLHNINVRQHLRYVSLCAEQEYKIQIIVINCINSTCI